MQAADGEKGIAYAACELCGIVLIPISLPVSMISFKKQFGIFLCSFQKELIIFCFLPHCALCG